MRKLKILLVDDHEVVRLGLTTLLEDVPDVEVIAETGLGSEAVRLCGEPAHAGPGPYYHVPHGELSQ